MGGEQQYPLEKHTYLGPTLIARVLRTVCYFESISVPNFTVLRRSVRNISFTKTLVPTIRQQNYGPCVGFGNF